MKELVSTTVLNAGAGDSVITYLNFRLSTRRYTRPSHPQWRTPDKTSRGSRAPNRWQNLAPVQHCKALKANPVTARRPRRRSIAEAEIDGRRLSRASTRSQTPHTNPWQPRVSTIRRARPSMRHSTALDMEVILALRVRPCWITASMLR